MPAFLKATHALLTKATDALLTSSHARDGPANSALGPHQPAPLLPPQVIMIDPKKMMVTVEGVNIMSKNVKPMKEGEQGRILKREVGIHMSNVAPTGEKAPVAEEAAPAVEEK